MDRNPVVNVLPERYLLVALRKESVDRNASIITYVSCARQSLSARRAWIEIIHRCPHHFYLGVALRKESVDRNAGAVPTYIIYGRRSPQGERG